MPTWCGTSPYEHHIKDKVTNEEVLENIGLPCIADTNESEVAWCSGKGRPWSTTKATAVLSADSGEIESWAAKDAAKLEKHDLETHRTE